MAQDDPWVPTVDQLVSIPGSPEASAFAEYGKTPVSHYNGTPNITVPLGSISGRSFSLPLSLTYDAGGIKVEQIAGSPGLGWNLNVGGMVVRQVNGLPDDYKGANPEYYAHYSNVNYTGLGTSKTVKGYYDYFLNNSMTVGSHTNDMLKAFGRFTIEFENRKIDIQPDTYSFHAPGLSGSFFVDYDNIVSSTSLSKTYRGVSINGPELDIEVRVDLPNGDGIQEINLVTVKDNSGTRYIFQTPETSYVKDQDNDGKWREYNSSWLLTSIYTANDRDEVQFQYTAGSYWDNEQYLNRGEVLRGLITETADCQKGSTASSSAAPTHRVKQPLLSQIRINTVLRATFAYGQRSDVAGKKRIDKINLFKQDGSSLEVVKFDNTSNFESKPNPTSEFERRLKLSGISFWGANESARYNDNLRRDYAFEYDETERLPSRGSTAQDYWGYSNGQNEGQSLIPGNPDYDAGTIFSGGDRSVDLTHTKAGVLTKIIYPTGGFTEYHYQGNRVIGNPVVSKKSSIQKVLYGNGGIIGAVNTNDPSNYGSCDDNATTELPALFEDSFQLTEAGGYYFGLNITSGISATTNEDVMRFFLYKGAARSYCTLKADVDNGNDSYILFSESQNAPTSISRGFTLEANETYRVLIISNSVDVAYEVFRNETVTSSTANDNFPVGGLRLYKTVDKPEANQTAFTRYFYYDDLKPVIDAATLLNDAFFAGSQATSAVLQQPVSMQSPAPSESRDENRFYTCEYVNRLSTNQYRPLGGMIGYTKVTEVVWANNEINGFTVYEFQNQDRSTQRQTTGPSLNGRVIHEIVYDQNGNKLRQTDSEYEAVGLAGTGGLELNSTLHGYYDMKVIGDKVAYTRVVVNKFQGQYEIGPCNTSDADCLRKAPQNLYEQATYSIGQGWLRLKKTTVTNYDGADELIRVTTHAYENTPVHYQPITIQTEAGDQQVYTTYLYYPDDLNDIYMSNLVAANRTGEVIETIEYKGTDNTGIELRKKKTSFKLIGGTKVYPDKLYFSQKGHPLEERIEFVEYDNHGNPLEVIQTGGASEAYAWGYGGTLPVINAKNASSAELTAAIAAAITATPLPTGIDTLEELLSHVGNLSMPDQRSDWAFFTQKLNEQLSNAQVSTMTYDTVYGMTSQTTPNGMVQYFEYDAYGRLKYIKDRDLNILKMNEYAYKVNAGSTQN